MSELKLFKVSFPESCMFEVETAHVFAFNETEAELCVEIFDIKNQFGYTFCIVQEIEPRYGLLTAELKLP